MYIRFICWYLFAVPESIGFYTNKRVLIKNGNDSVQACGPAVAEQFSKIINFFSALTRVFAQENHIVFTCCESLKH